MTYNCRYGALAFKCDKYEKKIEEIGKGAYIYIYNTRINTHTHINMTHMHNLYNYIITRISYQHPIILREGHLPLGPPAQPSHRSPYSSTKCCVWFVGLWERKTFIFSDPNKTLCSWWFRNNQGRFMRPSVGMTVDSYHGHPFSGHGELSWSPLQWASV